MTKFTNKKELDKNSEARILEAAKQEFHLKGYEGARMQVIADKAGINKAMLHYYYKTKDKLFEAVFKAAISKIFPVLEVILNEDVPLFDKIRKFVSTYLGIIMQNKYIPLFIIHELITNPEKLARIIKKIKPDRNIIFENNVKLAIKNNEIYPIDSRQLFVNMVSLCVFPVIAEPIIKTVLGMNDAAFKQFLENRKKEAAEFIINSIKIK